MSVKFTACLVFAILAASLMLGDAYPQGGLGGLAADGKILLHTSGIENGHKHTANCFGFNQGGGQPATTAATTTTASSG